MRARFNDDLLLWAIATLQPASLGDALAFIREIFSDITPLPLVKELEPLIADWQSEDYLVRVHGKSKLFSVTQKGNGKLPVRLRRHRDKTRLFLLKAAHDAKVIMSGDAQQGLVGASPPIDSSTDIQEGSRPISSDGWPREPRPAVRTYWPRVVKQLDFKVGSEPRSPDTFFQYYSYPSVHAVHAASNSGAAPNDLNITDLAIALGISPRLLTSFIHKPSHHYRQFEIGKRGGGSRVISSPKTFLKVVQYWLLDYFLFDLPVHNACHSYRKGHSILNNAEPHVGKRFVGNIDIEDYFGSINKKMIQQILRKNDIGERLSNSISRLVTLNDSLPQGAPTSPLLSNAILFDFDSNLSDKAAELGLVYTRYADDITISGNVRENIVYLIDYAANYLKNIGLRLNQKKTRIASSGGQQRVTGVVVNEKAQPPRELRRRVRAMFHQAEQQPEKFSDRISELRGYYSYLRSYPSLRGSPELCKYRKILEILREQHN